MSQYDYKQWESGEESFDASGMGVMFYGLKKGHITQDEFDSYERVVNQVYSERRKAFKHALKLNLEGKKRNFNDAITGRNRQERKEYLSLELDKTREFLANHREKQQELIAEQEDIDFITFQLYSIIQNSYKKYRRTQIIDSFIFLNDHGNVSVEKQYLKWLESIWNKPIHNKILEDFFDKKEPGDYERVMDVLTNLSYLIDKPFAVKINNNNIYEYKWDCTIPASQQYIIAFLLQLIEQGWIKLVKGEGKKSLSQADLMVVVENTFGVEFGKEAAGKVLRQEQFDNKYTKAFIGKIPKRNK